jgi:hypothetical protein
MPVVVISVAPGAGAEQDAARLAPESDVAPGESVVTLE